MSDVIIIGAGPAGISAALYTIRSGLETTVIAAGDSALAKAEKIENYYGFAEPISGKELLTRGIDGAERLGVKFTNKQAVSIDYEDGGFSVVTSDDKKHMCKAVLLATGSRRLAPNIEGLTNSKAKGSATARSVTHFFTETKTSAFSAPANTLCTRPKFSQKHQKALPCSQTAKSRRQYFPRNLQLLKNRCRVSRVKLKSKKPFCATVPRSKSTAFS